MYKVIIPCFLLCYGDILQVHSQAGDQMIGDGRWKVINFNHCPNADKYEQQVTVQRKKHNRTHDCFNANIDLAKPLHDNMGIRVDICKNVDGGCKDYQILSDDSFVNFCTKYAESNMMHAFELAGLEYKFPVEEGHYTVKEYIMDYCELPLQAVYGSFTATVYILDGKEEVACLVIHVEFYETDEVCGEEK